MSKHHPAHPASGSHHHGHGDHKEGHRGIHGHGGGARHGHDHDRHSRRGKHGRVADDTLEKPTPACMRPDGKEFIAARDAALQLQIDAWHEDLRKNHPNTPAPIFGNALLRDALLKNGWGVRPPPVRGATIRHYANDLVVAPDQRTPGPVLVYPQATGRVLYAGHFDNVSGNVVLVGYDDGTMSALCHLKDGSITVIAGQRVFGEQLRPGDPLPTPVGEMGQTGCASGPGLHITRRIQGSPDATAAQLADAFDHESTSVLFLKFGYNTVRPIFFGKTWEQGDTIPGTLAQARQAGLVTDAAFALATAAPSVVTAPEVVAPTSAAPAAAQDSVSLPVTPDKLNFLSTELLQSLVSVVPPLKVAPVPPHHHHGHGLRPHAPHHGGHHQKGDHHLRRFATYHH